MVRQQLSGLSANEKSLKFSSTQYDGQRAVEDRANQNHVMASQISSMKVPVMEPTLQIQNSKDTVNRDNFIDVSQEQIHIFLKTTSEVKNDSNSNTDVTNDRRKNSTEGNFTRAGQRNHYNSVKIGAYDASSHSTCGCFTKEKDNNNNCQSHITHAQEVSLRTKTSLNH